MSLTLKNRVFETTTTVGVGSYLLAGVVNASFRPFSDIGNGGLVPYVVEQGTKSEWGIGTYSSGANTLARTTIFGNYLGTTSPINWTSGTKNIYSPDIVELFTWITFANNATVAALTLAESAAPSTPASGFGSIYAKADGKLYFKNDAGTETDLTLSGYSDHGLLTGLSDDDHSQYALANGQRWTTTQTVSRAVVSDASGYLVASSVTTAELDYLSGVTSSIQSQLNNLHAFAAAHG